MAAAPRMLLAGGSDALRRFAEDLLKAGRPVYRAETVERAAQAARAECPDIVIADVALLADAKAFVGAVAESSAPFRPVVVAVAPEGLDAARRQFLDSAVDEVLVGTLEPETAVFRLQPLGRLVTMRNELVLRRQTLARLTSQTGGEPAAPADLPVLVLSSKPALANALGNAVGAASARAIFSDSPFQAERILATEECSALLAVTDESSRDEVLGLCYQVRKNARLFHLPVILAAHASLAAAPAEAYSNGANLVVPLEIAATDLAAEISGQLVRHKRRRMLRDRLLAVVPAAYLDTATGLAAESFLAEHLATLLESYSPRRRPLSVLDFTIRNLDAATAKHGAANAARLHGEIARWIQRLIRAEDMAARVGSDSFVVILPNTDDADARSAMYRIDDVLSHTEFGLDGQPFTLWIASGHASAQSGDSTAKLLARTREAPGSARA